MALYHSAKGNASYTINGNPTIIDGVVTGLSGQDYIKFQALPSSFQELEINLRYVLNQRPTNWQLLFGPVPSTTPRITFINNRYRLEFLSSGTLTYMQQWGIPPEIDVVCNYNVKITADKIEVKYTNLNNGTIKTDSFEGVVDVNTFFEQAFAFGYSSSFESLDLNHTYIKIDGAPWFGVCPIEVKKHQIMGPVGYTVVGSPTITSGVVSGFSTNNYLDTTLPFDITQPFQIHFDITNFSNTGSSQYVFGLPDISTGVYLGASATGLAFSHSSTYWSAISGLTVGTPFTLDLIGDGTNLTIATVQSGTNKTNSKSLSDLGFSSPSSSIIRIGKLYQAFTSGTINFNNTYIKVNGKLWFWQPQETKYIQRNNQLVWADPKLYLTGPVNYTVVGTPTIVDGVVSGFSNSDYVTVPYFLPFSKNSFEYVIKFKIGISNSGTNGTIFSFPYRKDGSQGAAYGIYKYSNALTAYCGYNANGDNITLSIPFTANSDMWVKWSFANGILKLTYSTDGINWNVGVNNEGGIEILDGTAQDISLGRISSWPGFSVDLNHTYIKVNDQLWFYGKNNATQNIAPVPAGYTYGTTTTTSIGYVDMRTQQFTQAPEGATIGRDE